MSQKTTQELIQEISANYKELFSRKETLTKQISKVDKEREDILHYIELGKYNAVEGWKLLSLLREVSKERRKIKDEEEYISKVTNNIKLSTVNRFEKSKPKTYHFRSSILNKKFSNKVGKEIQ